MNQSQKWTGLYEEHYEQTDVGRKKEETLNLD